MCLDRTEWDFGQCPVNILLVPVGTGDVHVPLYWHLLDNRSGNANAADRIAVLETYVALLGKDRIGLVVGDRAESLARHGLNLLRQLTRPLIRPDDPLARLFETLLNWIARQLARNQLLKIAGPSKPQTNS